MTRDPLGSDPLGIEPIQAQVAKLSQSESQRALSAYANNVLLRGVTMVDRTNPAPVGPPVGDDGKVLTYEDRLRIAAERRAYDPDAKDLGYSKDLQDRVIEPLGESTQKAIDAQPRYTAVTPRDLPLPPPELA